MRTLELHQLAVMAYLHYREEWTQDDIARHMGMSRFKIMRGLREARERGIIRFEIDASLLSLASLEVELGRAFGLDSVVVVAAPSPTEALDCVAAAGAEYLENNIQSGAVVGVSWGPTVRVAASLLRKQAGKSITVVELMGGVNSSATNHAAALDLARAYDSERRCYLLECPAIVRNRDLRDSLLAEHPLRAAMEVTRAADVALFSTSDLELALRLLEAGYITSDDLADLRRAGAVGNLYGRFLDAEGQECDTSIRERTLGLSLDEIRSIARKICITCGTDKLEPVSAALRGGLINVLITDEATATALLARRELDNHTRAGDGRQA